MSRPLLRCLLVFPLALIALPAFAGTSPPAPATPAPVAPEFAGITHWINSPPLSMQALRGKVVLVDFWAFECVNCLHTLPHLKSLYARYKDQGLVVIGVHTPELQVERNRSNLVRAVRTLGIDYPVAQDSNDNTWNAWGTRYWPTQYLVDRGGHVVLKHIGEGQYQAIEDAVRAQLGLPPT
jgi:thiol-disulfide isomerase/thioredoxin